MGVIQTITHNTFPKQGDSIGRKASLCFHYNSDLRVDAIVVRDDVENPFRTIFKTEDGRLILSTECHYSWKD